MLLPQVGHPLHRKASQFSTGFHNGVAFFCACTASLDFAITRHHDPGTTHQAPRSFGSTLQRPRVRGSTRANLRAGRGAKGAQRAETFASAPSRNVTELGVSSYATSRLAKSSSSVQMRSGWLERMWSSSSRMWPKSCQQTEHDGFSASSTRRWFGLGVSDMAGLLPASKVFPSNISKSGQL